MKIGAGSRTWAHVRHVSALPPVLRAASGRGIFGAQSHAIHEDLMQPMHTAAVLLLALSALACAKGDGDEATDTSRAAGASAAGSDPDVATGGQGIPAGYAGRTDRESVNIAEASYTSSGNGWEVKTGPAHIMYAAKDSATGTYTVSTTIQQMAAPAHPEAFGLFIGGQNLDQPSQKYTYFVVRGTGEYLVKVRDGTGTRDVVKWTASGAIPKQDAGGKASYRLSAQVTADSVRFMVNDSPVTSIARSAVETNGIAGLRINHNLHLTVQPVAIRKQG